MTDIPTTAIPRDDLTPKGKRRQGFVYFITDGDAVKIGFSHWPPARMADLQSSHPKVLSLINYFPGTIADEQRLHRHFSGRRIRGEWFTPGEEIDALIQKLEGVRQQLISRITSIWDVVEGRPPRTFLRPKHFASKDTIVFERWFEAEGSTLPRDLRDLAKLALLNLYLKDQRGFENSEMLKQSCARDLSAFTSAIGAYRAQHV